MLGQEVVTSSSSDEWYTPPEIFKALDDEFHFTLDPCCTAESALCETYFTKEDNGLDRSWGGVQSLL